jgi:uncharacterized protein
MEKKYAVPAILIVFSLSLLMIGGCASTPPARFYTLSALSSPEKAPEVQSLTQGRIIGLGPIRFPDYLDRRGIVTRTSSNTLNIAEFHLWAGSLKEDFTRVLLENFYLLMGNDKIVLYPFGPVIAPGLRVLLNVTRFDGDLGDKVFLDAGWIILEGPEKKEGISQISRITEPVNGSDYSSLAAAQSRAVERLSREIAKVLQALPAPSSAKSE